MLQFISEERGQATTNVARQGCSSVPLVSLGPYSQFTPSLIVARGSDQVIPS